MTAVLPADDGSNYFGPSNLRRSHSQTSFHSTNTAKFAPRPPTPSPSSSPAEEPTLSGYLGDSFKPATSPVFSSAPSSPQPGHSDSTDFSYASTPASTCSFISDFDDTLAVNDSDEEEFGYPSFLPDKLFVGAEIQPDDNLEPPPSPTTGHSYTVSDQDSDNTSRPDSPEFSEHAEDDTAVKVKPSRQVDYLSHDWKEEDIWSSWRYIISRRGEYANSARLENASWRTWMKSKNNLRTVSPETLNWLKDCDVTWLYGPLQSMSATLSTSQTAASSTAISKTHSLVSFDKKPCLKKRSMSELMLQKSLSSASLLKQATAAVQAQETRGAVRPHLGRANTDYVTSSFSSRRLSHATSTTMGPSTESSGITSPTTERKHIHFNEQVEQCIAIDVKGYDEEDLGPEFDDDESDPDNDGVMMKPAKTKKRLPVSRRRRRRKSTGSDGKIIAKLPSTTLKYRDDMAAEQDSAMKHSTGPYRNSVLSPSSSQETLRPSRKAGRFIIGEDDDDDEMEDPFGGPSGWRSPPSGQTTPTTSGSTDGEPKGMRRTPSGMFMPYEEGEQAQGDGIFGRVVDTVNTARDIAHVIWNVGWRK